MTAPSVSGDPSEEFEGFSSIGNQGIEQKSPRLVLTDEQWRLEHLLAAAVAIELVRVVAPSDSRTTARYAAEAVDNSRGASCWSSAPASCSVADAGSVAPYAAC